MDLGIGKTEWADQAGRPTPSYAPDFSFSRPRSSPRGEVEVMFWKRLREVLVPGPTRASSAWRNPCSGRCPIAAEPLHQQRPATPSSCPPASQSGTLDRISARSPFRRRGTRSILQIFPSPGSLSLLGILVSFTAWPCFSSSLSSSSSHLPPSTPLAGSTFATLVHHQRQVAVPLAESFASFPPLDLRFPSSFLQLLAQWPVSLLPFLPTRYLLRDFGCGTQVVREDTGALDRYDLRKPAHVSACLIPWHLS